MKCNKCGQGNMIEKNGKNGAFLACDQYPNCRNTESVKDFKPVEVKVEKVQTKDKPRSTRTHNEISAGEIIKEAVKIYTTTPEAFGTFGDAVAIVREQFVKVKESLE